MTKKILFLLHLPPPIHGASVVGQYIHNSKIINSSFDNTYINMSASSTVEEVGRLNLKKIIFLFTNWLQCIQTIIKLKPDLCYMTPSSDGWGFYRDFLLLQSIKLFNVKIVLHFHNKASEKWISKRINRSLLKIFFEDVKIILLGKELYAEKVPFIDEKDVFYCANGVPAVASQVKSNLNKKNEETRFLFLSNMLEEKGIFILLQACKILKKQNYKFQCDFIGKWKDVSETEFNEKISHYELEGRIIAHGAKYGDDKVAFFEQADVFVFPTYYHGETFGLVLLEAMDYALPCISTINGAITSVIENGETGYCLPQKDVEKLAEHMIWMIENPNERIIMGEKGKKRFEQKFTIEKFEQNLKSIFYQCLKS